MYICFVLAAVLSGHLTVNTHCTRWSSSALFWDELIQLSPLRSWISCWKWICDFGKFHCTHTHTHIHTQMKERSFNALLLLLLLCFCCLSAECWSLYDCICICVCVRSPRSLLLSLCSGRSTAATTTTRRCHSAAISFQDFVVVAAV